LSFAGGLFEEFDIVVSINPMMLRIKDYNTQYLIDCSSFNLFQKKKPMTDRHFHTLKLTKIIQQTKLASTLELEVPKELKDVFTFKAGQYLTFKIVIADEELRRSYSINSASGLDEPLQVTVKKVKQGKVSNYFVDNLSVGDELEVMPPLGNFSILIIQLILIYNMVISNKNK